MEDELYSKCHYKVGMFFDALLSFIFKATCIKCMSAGLQIFFKIDGSK